MTCIVGIVHDGKVYIGGDRAGVSGLDVTIRKDPKVFKKASFVYGFTSSFRMGQLLQGFCAPLIRKEDKEDIYKYMTTKYITKLRKYFKDGGFSRIDSNEEEGGVFLVGYKDRLFRIGSDFQVGESVTPYASVGCGAKYSLGVLYALSLNKKPYCPQVQIDMALQAATFFSGGVRPPFNIVNT